jgi:hypothetical protein
MSARDRAAREASRNQEQFTRDAMDAAAALMDSSKGQALAWFLLRDSLRAEGPGSKGRRALAWDFLDALMVANRDGTLIMLKRHYQVAGAPDDEEMEEVSE